MTSNSLVPAHAPGIPTSAHNKTYMLDVTSDRDQALLVIKALASEWRLRILELLNTQQLSVNQIAQALDIPLSTATMHVKILDEAQMIWTQLQPAVRGQQKICSRRCEAVQINFPPFGEQRSNAIEVAMPIGGYVGFEVTPTCGLASDVSLIGMMDDPLSFWEPERLHAQILWFRHGYLDYHFPVRLPPRSQATSVQLRMEICSEAPNYNAEWPSDITVWINDVEVGTWTSPGDFGGTRGALTPDWWLDADTQFGQLKRWEVNEVGSFVDGVQISDVRLAALDVRRGSLLRARIGVKPDARHVGGINLFGRKFGNYPEDLTLRITFAPDP